METTQDIIEEWADIYEDLDIEYLKED